MSAGRSPSDSLNWRRGAASPSPPAVVAVAAAAGATPAPFASATPFAKADWGGDHWYSRRFRPPSVYLSRPYKPLEVPDAKNAVPQAKEAAAPRDARGETYSMTKYSFGIIVCRKRANCAPEVVVVRKRFTYAYSEFVNGKYSRNNSRGVMALLNAMTTEELLDLWSLNFSQMWYRAWLTSHNDQYAKKYAKWHTSFIRHDGGAALKKLILQAKGGNDLLWEVPKGHPQMPREPDLMCAVRELREETDIDKKEYRIVPGATRTMCRVDMGVRYICKYYIAVSTSGRDLEARPPAARAIERRGEIGAVRWMSLKDIRTVDDAGGSLLALVAPALRVAKKFATRGVAPRLPSPPGQITPPAAIPERPSSATAPPASAGPPWETVKKRKGRAKKAAGRPPRP